MKRFLVRIWDSLAVHLNDDSNFGDYRDRQSDEFGVVQIWMMG